MALEHGASTAVIAFAQARCGVAELFPARMRQLDRGAAILRREADLDQLLSARTLGLLPSEMAASGIPDQANNFPDGAI